MVISKREWAFGVVGLGVFVIRLCLGWVITKGPNGLHKYHKDQIVNSEN